MQQELLIQPFKKQQIIIYSKDTQGPQVSTGCQSKLDLSKYEWVNLPVN